MNSDSLQQYFRAEWGIWQRKVIDGGCFEKTRWSGGKCIKSYVLFLYTHMHFCIARMELKIAVLVLLASAKAW